MKENISIYIRDKKFQLAFFPFFSVLFISFLLGFESFKDNYYHIIFLFFISSLNLILTSLSFYKSRLNIFLFLFNILFTFGSFLKLILFTKFPIFLREPIGSFNLNNTESFNNVFKLIATASFSILIVSIITLFIDSFFSKKQNIHTPRNPLKFLALFFMISASFLSLLNFKFNILMFGLAPSVILPFYGNVLFYLLLTRIVPFLYLFQCFNVKNYFSLLLASLFFLIVSLGVLSRMGIAIFFIVVLFSFLEFYDLNKINFKNLFLVFISVTLITIATVGLSTSARNVFYNHEQTFSFEKANLTVNINNIFKNSISVKSFEMFLDLTLARWIGLEAIMAVEAYPNKSWLLFKDALNEAPYKGNSFYNKILYDNKLIYTGKTYSSSVPGPVAFFYYTGSKTAVFVFLTIFLLFFSFLEKILWKYYSDAFSAACFVIVFTTIDFHQFGIAPLSFFKYLLFTIVCLIIFYPIKKYLFREKNEQN